jgi:hypothetical protein
MNAPDDEVYAEVERLRERQRRPLSRAFITVEKTLERLVLLLFGCGIIYLGWVWAKSLHHPIGDKPIGSLTLNDIGSNLFAGLVILVGWGIAVRVAFSRGTDRDRALQDQAQKNVTDRKRSEAAYAKSKFWGVITDPNFGRSEHRWLGVAILLITLAVLALIFVFAGRVH